ncbi:hypothetical protein [Dongshaea marina]|uniref:hypothetical protein n=1 Tax=Dongshaea marina TaxID=2047966 RepID=UPI000D3ED818|nr:hypothetical protein [Dongshaea marina]
MRHVAWNTPFHKYSPSIELAGIETDDQGFIVVVAPNGPDCYPKWAVAFHNLVAYQMLPAQTSLPQTFPLPPDATQCSYIIEKSPG